MKYFRLTGVLAVIALSIVAAGSASDPNDLVVHEWGTFTTIAGEDGKAIEWLPWNGASDLPCFVDRLSNNLKIKTSAKVRMETPVVYFYSTRETSVDVRVRFLHSLITEWFPHASPYAVPSGGIMMWNDVKVKPEGSTEFPNEGRPSHYYAARNTDAAPVEVESQKERFLFYRGIGNFELPIEPTMDSAGNVNFKNPPNHDVGVVFRLDNHNGKFGFRARKLFNPDISLEPPALNSDRAMLNSELVKTLVSAGLFTREAEAMVDTWRDSWFEEGSRLFYIVPRSRVDAVLPLDVKPEPKTMERVFVARVELITETTMKDVRRAIRTGDQATLERYGRFLEPIRDRIWQQIPLTEREKAQRLIQSVSSAYFARSANTCR